MFRVRCSSTAARSASDQGRFKTPRFPTEGERRMEMFYQLLTFSTRVVKTSSRPPRQSKTFPNLQLCNMKTVTVYMNKPPKNTVTNVNQMETVIYTAGQNFLYALIVYVSWKFKAMSMSLQKQPIQLFWSGVQVFFPEHSKDLSSMLA